MYLHGLMLRAYFEFVRTSRIVIPSFSAAISRACGLNGVVQLSIRQVIQQRRRFLARVLVSHGTRDIVWLTRGLK